MKGSSSIIDSLASDKAIELGFSFVSHSVISLKRTPMIAPRLWLERIGQVHLVKGNKYGWE